MKHITAKQAGSFDVCERRPVEIASGDKLLLTANRREPGFRATNGEIVTVEKIDRGRRIHLQDGRLKTTGNLRTVMPSPLTAARASPSIPSWSPATGCRGSCSTWRLPGDGNARS
jgi:hypothetical protein